MSKIDTFKQLPLNILNKSACIDLFHFVMQIKPAVRLYIENPRTLDKLAEWAAKHSFFIKTDAQNYVCIANNGNLANQILLVDRSNVPHELELGVLLGYPFCCCKNMSIIGENNIDLYAEQLGRLTFNGKFQLINPFRYTEGYSLICHLPCSVHCVPSLEIAELALVLIKRYAEEPFIQRWTRWLADFSVNQA